MVQDTTRSAISDVTLSRRLGITVHVSILEMKIKKLFQEFPSLTASVVEDWLLDVANKRGCLIVQRDNPPGDTFRPPATDRFSNEELVVGICLPHRLDRPQLLRLAGQFISHGGLDVAHLIHLSRQERAGLVLGELARQALKVDPVHTAWNEIAKSFPVQHELRSPVIHWQRLAWPVMSGRGCNAERWVLVK
jgi:hypothetical protein